MQLMGRLGWVLGASMLLSACAGSGDSLPQRVVLITLDTLRYDSFAEPGLAGEYLMPATRKLAERGLSFDNFYANTSTTQPSHASLFTGLQPWRHGVTRNGMLLDTALPNLALSLQASGFATHAVVSSFPLHAQFGFAQGFDHFDDEFDVPYVQNWEGRAVEQGRFFSLGESVTRRAVAALDSAPAGDQFFWFHYFDPHDPYGDTGENPMGVGYLLNVAKACDETRGMQKELLQACGLYERDVRALDAALAKLFKRLEADAERFETHIVLTADHGESFGELGAIGHGKRVTREQVQVPLVICSPRAGSGLRSDGASLVDLARTILKLAGHPATVFSGRDLVGDTHATDLPVLGMRRSFSKPKTETTSNGQRFPLEPIWFFSVKERALVSGNGSLALAEGDRARPLDGQPATAARGLFGALETLVEQGPGAVELTDESVRRALGALGYLDNEEE